MNYKEHINNLITQIPLNVIDFNVTRKRGTPPSQAFSDFITHSEQGDWAEQLFFSSLKESGLPYCPVRYGKSDKIIAGDPEFKAFYNQYQDELASIGKRPDILLIPPSGNIGCDDISKFSQQELDIIVPNAIAGFEVRSSAYLTKKFTPKPDRPFLSFTPKVEDLLVVLKWINIYNVPHFYIQVFFDAIYILPFEKILTLLVNSAIKEKGVTNKEIIGLIDDKPCFKIERNPKNQYKETIHIFLNNGELLSNNFNEPTLFGNRKELASGRLLHYVSFTGGGSKINEDLLFRLIQTPF